MDTHNKLAILCGGGPAPGLNSVIAAATIRARLEGVEVIGLRDGFEWIMQGDIDHTIPLTIEGVSRIHFRGGSHIGIARANPSKSPALLENTVQSLLRLNVSQLITIGGDDTAFSAMKLAEHAEGRLRVVHVPKTIDNDLDLPPHIDTFGFQTARHYGVEIVKNLMVDAKTTSRWYIVIAMGRTAGHLSLGIAKAAGATLSLIPEEFSAPLRLKVLVDTLVGAIIKRMSYGRRDGVAVIGEGVVLHLSEDDLAELKGVERDAHGHVRIAEINIGEILKTQISLRLKEFGLKSTLVAKNIGYELRCADPDSVRHGIHARSRLLRREVRVVWRVERDGLDAGRAVRADSVQEHARPEDRTRQDTARRRRLDALSHRAALHDSPEEGRLPRSARARQARRDRRAHERGVQQGIRVSRRQRSARGVVERRIGVQIIDVTQGVGAKKILGSVTRGLR